MSETDGLSIADIDKAIKNATSFQSMTVDDEGTVTNPSVVSLMKLREKLKREEELANGTRNICVTFDLSRQNL